MMTQTGSLKDVVDALLELDKQIRTFHPARGREPAWNETLRNLTAQEWIMVENTIKEYELLCSLVNDPLGFSFLVHEPSIDERGIRPAIILWVEDQQFPFESAKRGFDGQMETVLRLEPLTHRERNRELLARCGFQPLGEPGSYIY